MEYNLIKINQLDEAQLLSDGDFIVCELDDRANGGGFKSRRVRVDVAFNTRNVRLANSGLIQVDISDPMFDIDELKELKELLKNELISQDDANLVFATALEGLIKKVNKLPLIIMQPGTPDVNNPEGTGTPSIPDDPDGTKKYYPEGSLWVDTDTFRTYIYFYDRDSLNDEDITRHWVSITDR